MSDLGMFRGTQGTVQVALPFDLKSLLDGWSKVRSAMLKEVPDAFSRDEWAYLVAFLGKESLMLPFEQSFGSPEAKAPTQFPCSRARAAPSDSGFRTMSAFSARSCSSWLASAAIRCA